MNRKWPLWLLSALLYAGCATASECEHAQDAAQDAYQDASTASEDAAFSDASILLDGGQSSDGGQPSDGGQDAGTFDADADSGLLCDDADPDCMPCEDDRLEWNDDLPAPQIDPGRYDDLRICPGNRDYFAFTLEATDEIRARALFAHSAGDLSISLLDPSGTVVATSMTSDDDESLMYIVPPRESGVYHVSVTGVGDDVRNDYTLDVSVR